MSVPFYLLQTGELSYRSDLCDITTAILKSDFFVRSRASFVPFIEEKSLKNVTLLCLGNLFQYFSVIHISYNFRALLTEHFGTSQNGSGPLREELAPFRGNSCVLIQYRSQLRRFLTGIFLGFIDLNQPLPLF